MSCSVKIINGEKVVFNSNGEISQLYLQAKEKYGEEKALELFYVSQSDDFLEVLPNRSAVVKENINFQITNEDRKDYEEQIKRKEGFALSKDTNWARDEWFTMLVYTDNKTIMKMTEKAKTSLLVKVADQYGLWDKGGNLRLAALSAVRKEAIRQHKELVAQGIINYQLQNQPNSTQKNFEKGEITQEIINKLKQNGLSEEVFLLSTEEINAKLIELGVEADVRKQMIDILKNKLAIGNIVDENNMFFKGVSDTLVDLFFENPQYFYAHPTLSLEGDKQKAIDTFKNSSFFRGNILSFFRTLFSVSYDRNSDFAKIPENLRKDIKKLAENYIFEKIPDLRAKTIKIKELNLPDSVKVVHSLDAFSERGLIEIIEYIEDNILSGEKESIESITFVNKDIVNNIGQHSHFFIEFNKETDFFGYTSTDSLSKTSAFDDRIKGINRGEIIQNVKDIEYDILNRQKSEIQIDNGFGFNTIEDTPHNEALAILNNKNISKILINKKEIAKEYYENYPSIIEKLESISKKYNIPIEYTGFENQIEEQIQFSKILDDLGINIITNGFIYRDENGKSSVYVNKDTADDSLLLHEYNHLFLNWAKTARPELYAKGIDLIKKELKKGAKSEIKDIFDFVNVRQPELKGNVLLEEYLTEYVGRESKNMMDEQKNGSASKSPLMQWLSDFWDEIHKMLSLTSMTPEQVANLSLRDFARASVVDLLKGERIKGEITQQVQEQLVTQLNKAFPNTQVTYNWEEFKKNNYPDYKKQIGKNARERYEDTIRSKNKNITEEELQKSLDFLDSLEDNKENTKAIKIAVKWLSTDAIRLPFAIDNVKTAIELATKNKVDPMQFKSPMEIINKYYVDVEYGKGVDPDKLKGFSGKREIGEGENQVTIYDVDEGIAGQSAVIAVVYNAFGWSNSAKNSKQPWCLAGFTRTGKITDSAKNFWEKTYNSVGKKIAFMDGKPIAFMAHSNSYDGDLWWDLNDSPSNNLPLPNGDYLSEDGEIEDKIGEDTDFDNIETDEYDYNQALNEIRNNLDRSDYDDMITYLKENRHDRDETGDFFEELDEAVEERIKDELVPEIVGMLEEGIFEEESRKYREERNYSEDEELTSDALNDLAKSIAEDYTNYSELEEFVDNNREEYEEDAIESLWNNRLEDDLWNDYYKTQEGSDKYQDEIYERAYDIAYEYALENSKAGDENLHYIKNSKGEVLGAVTKDGKIYLNPNKLNLETPIHEFHHIYNAFLKQNKPELYKKGINLIKRELEKRGTSSIKSIIEYVEQTQPNLKGEDKLEEILTQLLGQRGVELIQSQKSSDLVSWLKEVWDSIKGMLGLSDYTVEQVLNMSLEEYAKARNVELLKGKDLKSFNDGVEFVQKAAEDYKKIKNIKGVSHPKVLEIYPQISQEISAIYEQSEVSSTDQNVVEAYEALENETIEQYNFITEKGLKVERWSGKGEPYANSKEMLNDLKNNKHLYFLPNDEAFGSDTKEAGGRIGLKKTNIKLTDGYQMTISEVFRVVHDYFGHGILGNQFGAIGEENATLQHLDLYSQKALPAVIFQTRGQNSWVNFSGVNKVSLEKMKEARQKKDNNLLEEAQKMFTFAEPKDNILPNKYNFKKYETARRIKEQAEIDKSTNQYGSNEISKLLPIISKNNVVTGGISRTSTTGNRQVQSYVLKNAVEVALPTSTQEAIKKAFPQITTFPKVYEITDGSVYRDLQIKGLEGVPMSKSVTIHTAEEYNQMRMFVTEDGHTGITLTKDGHLGGAFSSNKHGRKNDLAQLMIIGIKEGATNAEAYDTFLPDYYSNFGFKAVSRVEFNEEMADNWDYTEYSKYNQGKPDVVHFIYDGGDRNTVEERLGQFDLYTAYQKAETKFFNKDSYYSSISYMQNEVVKRYSFENKAQSRKSILSSEPTVEQVVNFVAKQNQTEEKLTNDHIVDLLETGAINPTAFYNEEGLFEILPTKLKKEGYSDYEIRNLQNDIDLQQKVKNSVERLKNTPIEGVSEGVSEGVKINEINSFGKLRRVNTAVTEKKAIETLGGIKDETEFEDKKRQLPFETDLTFQEAQAYSRAIEMKEVDREIVEKPVDDTEAKLAVVKTELNTELLSNIDLLLETDVDILENRADAVEKILKDIEVGAASIALDLQGLTLDLDFINNLREFLLGNNPNFVEQYDEFFGKNKTQKETVIKKPNEDIIYVKLNTSLSEEELYEKQGLIKVEDGVYIKTEKEDLKTLYNNLRTYTEKYPQETSLELYVQKQVTELNDFNNVENAEAVYLYKMYFDIEKYTPIKKEEVKDYSKEIKEFEAEKKEEIIRILKNKAVSLQEITKPIVKSPKFLTVKQITLADSSEEMSRIKQEQDSIKSEWEVLEELKTCIWK